MFVIFQLGLININVFPQSFKIYKKDKEIIVLNNVYICPNTTGKPKVDKLTIENGRIEIPLSSIKSCLFHSPGNSFSAEVVLKSGKTIKGSFGGFYTYLSGFDTDGVRWSVLIYSVDYFVASGYSNEIVKKNFKSSPNKNTHLPNDKSRNYFMDKPCPGLPTIVDSRDGQIYPTVKIGSQCWLQKNMNYKTGNSWCYGNSTTDCVTYGRLYDWETALKVCPKGWHLPSDEEWSVLITYLGGKSVASCMLKERSTSHWRYPNKDANNKSGFTALPGGKRNPDGSFSYLTDNTYFWSSNCAWCRNLNYYLESVGRGNALKSFGFSVRCVKD